MPPQSPAPRWHQLAAHRGVLGFLVRDGDAVRNSYKILIAGNELPNVCGERWRRLLEFYRPGVAVWFWGHGLQQT